MNTSQFSHFKVNFFFFSSLFPDHYAFQVIPTDDADDIEWRQQVFLHRVKFINNVCDCCQNIRTLQRSFEHIKRLFIEYFSIIFGIICCWIFLSSFVVIIWCDFQEYTTKMMIILINNRTPANWTGWKKNFSEWYVLFELRTKCYFLQSKQW